MSSEKLDNDVQNIYSERDNEILKKFQNEIYQLKRTLNSIKVNQKFEIYFCGIIEYEKILKTNKKILCCFYNKFIFFSYLENELFISYIDLQCIDKVISNLLLLSTNELDCYICENEINGKCVFL